MVQHVSIQSVNCHEPKHITTATTGDSGKVITASGSTNGESEFRVLTIDDIDTSGTPSPFTYWAYYADNQYTEASPRAITSATRAKITINGSGSATDTSNLPVGVDLWDTVNNIVTPEAEQDALMVRLTYKCSTAGTNAYVTHDLDIGGALGVILEENRRIFKESEATNRMVISWPVFCGSTFFANGGELYVTPSADIEAWDFAVSITRMHKGG